MIFPARMLKVRMIVYHRDSVKVLEGLRKGKLFHFSDYADSVERWGFKGIPNSEPYDELLSLFDDVQKLIMILESGSSRSFIQNMFPKPPKVDRSPFSVAQIRDKAEGYKLEVERLEAEKASLEKTREELQSHRTAIDLLEGFRRDIEKLGLPKHTRAFFGELPPDELSPLLISLSDNDAGKHAFYKRIMKGDEKKAVLLVLSEPGKEDVLTRIFKKHEFHNIPIPEDGSSMVEVLGRVRGVITELKHKEQRVSQRIEEKANAHLGVLRSYLAKLKYEIDMMKVRNMLGTTDKTVLIEGWIKQKERKRFEKIMEKTAGDRVELFYFEPDVRKGDIPVALENPGFIKPFELLTRMFSPPNYGEIDPTPFLALAFVLFFGIMFADIFDALMLLAFAFLFYRRFKESEDARSIGEIVMVCSLSALVFGMIGGEFAGFPVWAKHEILQPANLLLFALFLGLVQIVLGYVLGSINAIRSRDMNELIGGKLGWLLVMAGIGLAYFMYWQLVALSGLGVLLILAFKGMREVLDLTRLLSNLLSYVRLLALNMAHVGLSATFASIVGGLFALGIAGQVSGGILILIAHVFMVVVSLFAVFAHALRLQYVEFFSKFYEGGGTIFNPF